MITQDTIERIEADQEAGNVALGEALDVATKAHAAARDRRAALQAALESYLSGVGAGMLTKDEARGFAVANDLPKSVQAVLEGAAQLETVFLRRLHEAKRRLYAFGDGIADRREALETREAAALAAEQANIDRTIKALESRGLAVVPARKGGHS